MHYNEKGDPIDTDAVEKPEQDQAQDYILPNDVVLEIGARFGTVSSVIQKQLARRDHHVAVEPDPQILPSLYRNRYLNDDQYKIFEGILSDRHEKNRLILDGYGSRASTAEDDPSAGIEITVLTYKQFLEKFPMSFNVLVVDCEGCFEDVLATIDSDIDRFRLILVEQDQSHLCDYTKTHNHLIEHGFTLTTDGFHRVYTRQPEKRSKSRSKYRPWLYILLFVVIICIITGAVGAAHHVKRYVASKDGITLHRGVAKSATSRTG